MKPANIIIIPTYNEELNIGNLLEILNRDLCFSNGDVETEYIPSLILLHLKYTNNLFSIKLRLSDIYISEKFVFRKGFNIE